MGEAAPGSGAATRLKSLFGRGSRPAGHRLRAEPEPARFVLRLVVWSAMLPAVWWFFGREALAEGLTDTGVMVFYAVVGLLLLAWALGFAWMLTGRLPRLPSPRRKAA